MEDTRKELDLLTRALYKSKNSHGRTFYYRALVQAQRACRRALQKGSPPSMEKAKEMCTYAYISLSGNIPLGHHLGLSISLMGTLASLFSLLETLPGESSTEVPPPYAPDEIERIWNE